MSEKPLVEKAFTIVNWDKKVNWTEDVAEAVSGLIKDIYKDGEIDLCFSDKVLEYINKRMGNFNNSPSQQVPVDKREAVHGKKAFDVDENSILDTHVKKINGVEYISKDIHNTIFVDFVKKLKEELGYDGYFKEKHILLFKRIDKIMGEFTK